MRVETLKWTSPGSKSISQGSQHIILKRPWGTRFTGSKGKLCIELAETFDSETKDVAKEADDSWMFSTIQNDTK
jgi:hypothetical protein